MLDMRNRIRAELNEIKDPCSMAAGTPLGLDEMGLIRDVIIAANGDVTIDLRLTSPFCHMIGFFQQEATRRVQALCGAERVTLKADNGLDWSPSFLSPAAKAKRAVHLAAQEASIAS
ncbi:metal-sulfur cluster assembly factor [Sphingomonas faeni]|uniref:metal-sulfur cluster assembly factor n=1 Tax=Sphingomonas faeni TaxID=185950 RepID=UPI00335A4B5C